MTSPRQRSRGPAREAGNGVAPHAAGPLLIHRGKFDDLWADLPPLTVLTAPPGWGKTTLIREAAAQLGSAQATWVCRASALRQLHSRSDEVAASGAVCLVDGIEDDLVSDPSLWKLIEGIVGAGVCVVATSYDVPADIAATATVIDERVLAFDDDECGAIIAELHSRFRSSDLSLIPRSMRGCPWLVGRDVCRATRSAEDSEAGYPERVASELGSADLFLRALMDSEAFMASELGAALEASYGMPVFTRALLRSVSPGCDGTDFFGRMSAWPIFESTTDDEFGQDALKWVPQAWSTMSRAVPDPEQESHARAALQAEAARGSIVGQLRSLLLLGWLDEAEALARENLRLLTFFTVLPTMGLPWSLLRHSAGPWLAIVRWRLNPWIAC